MTAMNHEYYVSSEIAKLLKEAGFDWKCRKCYNKGVLFDMEPDEIRTQTPQHSSYDVLAPTLEVAQRWLREVKNCQVEIMYMYDKYGINIGKYVVIYTIQDRIHESLVDEESEQPIKLFEVYEKAQEAGIKKCLDVLLEEE